MEAVKIWMVWNLLLSQGVEDFLSDLEGGIDFFSCLTGKTIFNKCYKKAFFHETNNRIWVYIKYELEGGVEFVYTLKGVLDFFACVKVGF